MTLGKKIGSGFCLILFLTLILGIMNYFTMEKAANDSTEIAEDRTPRLLAYSELQNYLLLATYYTQTYTATLAVSDLEKAQDALQNMKSQISDIEAINQKHFFQQTDEFLQQFKRHINAYQKMIDGTKQRMDRLQNESRTLIQNAGDATSDIEKLISTMTATQKQFLEAGNYNGVSLYSSNIADTIAIYGRVARALDGLRVAEDQGNIDEFDRIKQSLPAIADDFKKIEKNLLRQECKDLYQHTLLSYNRFAQAAAEIAALQKENLQENKARMTGFTEMFDESEKMVNISIDNTRVLVQESASTLSKASNISLIILTVVLLIGIVVSILLTRSITKPLSTTQKFAESVATGHLDHELTVHGNDETGKLADALRSMVSALKSNISEAQNKSEQAQKATQEAQNAIARAEEAARRAENAKRDGMLDAANQLESMVEIISSASTELSAQIEQSDRGASESAQRLQEAATAMNQMNATVQEVARNAGSASAASTDTKQKAEAGEQIVDQVVHSIGEVHKVSLMLKDDMAQLNERAQDINRIMGVISDIADQTNLLALNAAIEAARAGEAGRGFAVVADEVRKLAEKTMTSTLDVSSAIRAIQESTDKSRSAFDLAVEKIGEATALANQSGTALQEIVSTVESTSDQVQAIAAASEEQSAASEEINRSITEVNDMSKMTADAMTEANQAVADLANQAQKLTSLIQQMKRG